MRIRPWSFSRCIQEFIFLRNGFVWLVLAIISLLIFQGIWLYRVWWTPECIWCRFRHESFRSWWPVPSSRKGEIMLASIVLFLEVIVSLSFGPIFLLMFAPSSIRMVTHFILWMSLKLFGSNHPMINRGKWNSWWWIRFKFFYRVIAMQQIEKLQNSPNRNFSNFKLDNCRFEMNVRGFHSFDINTYHFSCLKIHRIEVAL